MTSETIDSTKSLHLPSGCDSVPTRWKWSRLDEICNGVFDCPHSTPKLAEAGPFVVRTQDIITGVFRSEQAAHVSEETYDERTSRALPTRGDLLYSREGTYFGIAAEVPERTQVCLGQRMVLIRPKPDTVDFRFLRHWLNSPIMASHIHGYRDGSVAERLNLPTIRALPVLIPSIAEQRAIAHILCSLDDKIELNRRMNETLEGLARAIFQSWFVDFDPVRAKRDSLAQSHLAPATADFFPDRFEDSIIGLIPKGWEIRSLAEIMDIQGGTQPPASEFLSEPCEGYIRLVQIRDYETDSHLTFIPDTSKLRKCRRDDVMIARYGASVARVCWGLDGAYNVALVKAAPTMQCYREFLRSYLQAPDFQTRLIGMSNRSVQAGFNKGDIASFKIACPPDALFAAYQEVAWSLRHLVLQNRDQSRAVAAVRDALLPKLLSGEIRVVEAAGIVEDAIK